MKAIAVAQYTLEGKYVRSFGSIAEAARSVSKAKNDSSGEVSIRNCCNGITRTSCGFRWLFETDMDKAHVLFEERDRLIRKYGFTKEEVLLEGSKYGGRSEFKKKAPGHYAIANKLNLLEELYGDRINPFNGNVYSLYAYEFNETHCVYVGITMDASRRKNEHMKEGSPVYHHAREHFLDVPEPKYLLEAISQKEALIQEDAYRRKYNEEGWTVLNKAKTGLNSGSLGLCAKKHTRKEVRECASQCKTLSEFYNRFPNVYDYVCRNGMLGELDGLERGCKKQGTYSEEYCFYKALPYETLKDFRKKEHVAYAIALRNGWVEDYFWLKKEREKKGKVYFLEQPFSNFEEWEITVFRTLQEAISFAGFKRCADFKTFQRRAAERGLYFYS